MDLATLTASDYGTLTFDAALNKVIRTKGSWLASSPETKDYSQPGTQITISGSALNDGTYTVVAATATELTLAPGEPAANEGPTIDPVITGYRAFSLYAGYPLFINRHLASGDTNPPSRGGGAPTDPLSPIRRRVFIGDTPARGFPTVPSTAKYPAGTSLIGRGEDITSEGINRALYDLHRAKDSIAERFRHPPKAIYHLGAPIPPTDRWNLHLFWPSGVNVYTNKHLVWLGPPGTSAAYAKYFAVVLDKGKPVRDENLEVVHVVNFLSSAGGGSLYPAAPPSAGYFPDGGFGVLDDTPVANMFESTAPFPGVPGVDTHTTSLNDLCVYNYSLATRISQKDFAYYWRAFAIVTSHPAPGVAAKTNHADLTFGGDPELGWKKGDLIYYTTVAFAPTVQLSAQVGVDGFGKMLVSGGADRVMNGEGTESILPLVGFMQADVLEPCVEVGSDRPIFDFDGHDALIRTRHWNLIGGRIGYESFSVQDQKVYAPFIHLQSMAHVGDTVMFDDPSKQPFTRNMAPNQIQIEPPSTSRFANNWGTPIQATDIILDFDLVELYDNVAGQPSSKPVGLFVIHQIDTDTQARIVRIDGDSNGTGIPESGFFRWVRPHFHFSTGIASPGVVPIGDGLRIITQEGGSYGGLHVVGADADTAFDISQVNKSTGVPDVRLRAYASGDLNTYGDINALGYVGASDFRFYPVVTHYHVVPLACGEHAPSVFSSNWLFDRNSISWLMNPGGASGGPMDQIVFPLNLPAGVKIKRVYVQYHVNNLPVSPAQIVLVKALRGEASWSNIGPHVVVPFAALDTVSVTAPSPGGSFNAFWSAADIDEIVDNKEALYAIVVQADMTPGPTNNGDILYGIRVSYEMTSIRGA